MRIKEYLETIEGQYSRKFKRRTQINYLRIFQEPKSKGGITKEEIITFRKEIKRQLKENNKRAHKGDIILEIDFYTTQNNPPLLHTLTKNYLDLLHKKMEEDELRNLLFKDDNQIKILIANYHVDTFGNQTPEIRIKSYPISSFIKDIELTDRIINNKFSDIGHTNYRYLNREIESDASDTYDDLKDIDNNKDLCIKKMGQITYEYYRNSLIQNIQKKYLQANKIGIRDLICLFQHYFSYNTRYSNDERFQKIWNITRSWIFLSSDFIEIGMLPVKHGDSKTLKETLHKKLEIFKEKHKILLPLLQPINLTIIFIPPKHNVPDLDNLAKYIIPIIIENLKPPSNYNFKNKIENLNKLIQITCDNENVQKIPPYSISGYQIIEIPRKEIDPDNGRIDFMITDGFLFKSNIWNMINEVIDKWEELI